MMLTFNELVKEDDIDLGLEDFGDVDLGVLIEVVGKSTVLHSLNLDHSSLTLADGKLAAAIAKNKTIQVLRLSYDNNNINLQGVKYLAGALKENNTLEELYLGSNNIGDEGAEYIADMLAVNETLQLIYLSSNNITNKGAKSIATSLSANISLHTVYLQYNKIGNQGAEKLVEALESNHSIQTLDLWNNNVNKEMMNRIYAIVNDRKRKMLITTSMNDAKSHTNVSTSEVSTCSETEEVDKLKSIISSKDEEIASLKESLKNSKPIDVVDLTDTSSSKRLRTEDTPKSALAFQHEQNQKIVKVKVEKVAAETSLKSVREEKQRVEDEKELALECKICFEVKEERYALVPCGHIMCSVCKDSYRECPTCSRHVDSHLRVHL